MRLQRDARSIGPATEALIITVMSRRQCSDNQDGWRPSKLSRYRRLHPEQGFRPCLGILRLFRSVEASRIEVASNRAVEIGALSYAVQPSPTQVSSDDGQGCSATQGPQIKLTSTIEVSCATFHLLCWTGVLLWSVAEMRGPVSKDRGEPQTLGVGGELGP